VIPRGGVTLAETDAGIVTRGDVRDAVLGVANGRRRLSVRVRDRHSGGGRSERERGGEHRAGSAWHSASICW
jgi:CBS domain-containing protein